MVNNSLSRIATLRLAVRTRISRTIRSITVRSTMTVTVGMGLRLISQTLAFVVISRFLGATEFGAFVSVSALVAIIAAFSGWGADLLIIRAVARSPTVFGQAWGRGLIFLGVSAPVLALAAMLIVPMLVNASIPLVLVGYVVGADIVFAPIITIGVGCYRAVDRPLGASLLYAGGPTARLIAALLWAKLGSHDAQSWAIYYCGASAVFAIVSLWLVGRHLGPPVWRVAWDQWRDGFQFSLMTASGIAASGIVTPMVALLSDLATAGIYGAAIRIVEAAVIPFHAFMFSILPRFFRSGALGMRESLKLAIRMLSAGVVTALFGSLCIILIAPVAPDLLGQSYADSGNIIMMLAPLPVLYGLYFLAADVLVSSSQIWSRVLLQCLVPIVNVAFCVMLVPPLGAVGAGIAVLITNATMAVGAWALAIILSYRTDEVSAEPRLGQKDW